jgi:hypothetical protein
MPECMRDVNICCTWQINESDRFADDASYVHVRQLSVILKKDSNFVSSAVSVLVRL